MGVKSNSSASLSQMIHQAVTLHLKGGRAEAERLYLQILKTDPNHFDAQHLLGVLRYQQGRNAEALNLIGRSLKTNPDEATVLSNYGLVLATLDRLEEALVSYERALAIKPDYAEALNNRGNTLRDLNRLEDALRSYDKALVINPNYAEAFNNRGNTLRDLNRLDDALASYDKALTINPIFAEALNNRGTVLRDLNCFEDALASYEKALAVKPDYAEALYNHANTLRELKRLEDALMSYDKALAIKPDYAEALNNRGNTLQELNRSEEALACYEKTLAIKSDHADALKNYGIVLKDLGRLADARRAAGKAIQLAPRKASYYRAFGDLHPYVAGDPHVGKMEELIQDSASLSVDDRIELHFALAKAYKDLGRWADAFSQLLEGNALKRRQIAYDEAETLAPLKRIVEGFTPDLMRTRQGVGEPSPVPVFIVGMPRSGTTLVEQILASHPQVFGAGELKYFGQAASNLRVTENRSQSLRELISHMRGDRFRTLGENYLTEIKRLAPQAARITDKMPSNYAYLGLIHMALPNATIIHTIRDPVDTCVSCYSTLFAEGHNYTYDLAELGRYYRYHYQALMAHWHRVLPFHRILDVRYEDVVADVEAAARRMVAHCGLEWDARCLDFHQTERPVHTASAVQVRQPIYRNSVARGRRYEAFLAPLLAELDL